MPLGAHQQKYDCQIAPSMGIAADTIELLRSFTLLFILARTLLLWAKTEWGIFQDIVKVTGSWFVFFQCHEVIAVIEWQMCVRNLWQYVEDLQLRKYLTLFDFGVFESLESFISFFEETWSSIKLTCLNTFCSYEICYFHLWKSLILFLRFIKCRV